MNSVLNVGREKYVPATEKGQSHLKIQLKLFWYFLSFLYALFVGGIESIIACFQQREKSLNGQLAVVTGGGNGLGKAICLRLAEEKCNIAVVDVDISAAEVTALEIRSLGVKSKAYKVDVSNYEEILTLRSQILNDFRSVDLLINNAGLVTKISLSEGTPEDIQKVINVNIASNFWTTRVFLKDMIAQQRGHIVGISSLFGLVPSGRSILYNTTKYAVRGFMSCLSEEIRLNNLSSHIKTTCIYPLFISTRDDLISALVRLKFFNRIVVMSPKYAADQIVSAIKKEKLHAPIPNGVYTLTGLLAILPRRIMERYFDTTFGKIPPIY